MGRLFWKIFSWFWIALVILNVCVGWGVKLYYEQIQENDDKQLRSQMEAIAQAFEQGDIPRARASLGRARSSTGTPIFVITKSGKDFLGRPLPGFIRSALNSDPPESQSLRKVSATLPNGNKIQLVALYRPSWKSSFRNTPLWIGFSITLVISTLVCYWLARYLSSPVQRLSSATRQLAEGNLDVRVGKMYRRDEIADLATDFDRMADKIQQLLGLQKQLLQDISHELRSPLARLQVALALVQRNSEDNTGSYDRIARDLDRLEELIGEVLTLSRLDSVPYKREPVELQELIAMIVDDCNLEAEAKNCRVTLDVAENFQLDASPELLRRAIENVLRNAIKFTYPNTAITVELTGGKESAILITDQGPGIPEASSDKMFEAFVRVDPARPHKPGGYGLGLAIAKKAIELHGGTIGAANNPDGGLTVKITLPGQPTK